MRIKNTFAYTPLCVRHIEDERREEEVKKKIGVCDELLPLPILYQMLWDHVKMVYDTHFIRFVYIVSHLLCAHTIQFQYTVKAKRRIPRHRHGISRNSGEGQSSVCARMGRRAKAEHRVNVIPFARSLTYTYVRGAHFSTLYPFAMLASFKFSSCHRIQPERITAQENGGRRKKNGSNASRQAKKERALFCLWILLYYSFFSFNAWIVCESGISGASSNVLFSCDIYFLAPAIALVHRFFAC